VREQHSLILRGMFEKTDDRLVAEWCRDELGSRVVVLTAGSCGFCSSRLRSGECHNPV
jgi:hypothetical protein